MRLPLLTLLILLACAPPELQARVFVSLAGTLLEAEITAVTGDNVTLRRANDNLPLVVKRSTLCKEDNAYITRWVAENPDKTTTPAASTASARPSHTTAACPTSSAPSACTIERAFSISPLCSGCGATLPSTPSCATKAGAAWATLTGEG